MASPSYIQSSPSRPHTPTQRMSYYPERIRLNTPYPEIVNYMYNPYAPPPPAGYPLNSVPYPPPPPPGYPPIMPGYPISYNISAADMVDGPMDSFGGYNAYPYYPMYYNIPHVTPKRTAYRSHSRPKDVNHREHREEQDSDLHLNDKRSAIQEKLKKMNHLRNSSSPPDDVNPESLKTLLYDTIQQEMSALEVLKQQIASFTLLTHTLEEKSQPEQQTDGNVRLGRASTVETVTTTAQPPNPPPHVDKMKATNFIPQFDSQPSQNQSNVKSPLASMNFVNPFPYFAPPYQYPSSVSEIVQQQQQQPMQLITSPPLMNYNPYAFAQMASMYPPLNYVSQVTPSQTPQMDTPAQPSFITMAGTTTTPVPLLPTEPVAHLFPTSSVRPIPAAAYANSSSRRMYPAEDPLHDLAIKTLYDVEDKLRAAELSIAEKINEFETEVSVQSRLGAPLPMSNQHYLPYNEFQVANRRSRSLDEETMRPEMVKDLAVRALQAIDRRLREAERTIDRTMSNFDEIDHFGRAVRSATREVGVQTPRMEIIYDSDTDDSRRTRN